MGYLDNEDVCPLPWVVGKLNYEIMDCCCYATLDKERFDFMEGPWSDKSKFDDWWNGSKMQNFRTRMINEGARKICPPHCSQNRIPKAHSNSRQLIASMRKRKDNKLLDLIESDIDNGSAIAHAGPLRLSLPSGLTCNAKCQFCMQRYAIDKEINSENIVSDSNIIFFGIREIKHMLNFLTEDVNTCCITGGDLFALPDRFLDLIIKKAEENNIILDTITNMIGLTLSRYDKYVDKNFSRIAWSTTTLNNEEYKQFNGVDSCEKVKKNIMDISRKYGNKHVINTCSFCTMKHNYNKLHDFIKFCGDNRIGSINLLSTDPQSLVARGLGEYSLSHPANLRQFISEWGKLSEEYLELGKEHSVFVTGIERVKDGAIEFAIRYFNLDPATQF